jgi:hypothetical protein
MADQPHSPATTPPADAAVIAVSAGPLGKAIQLSDAATLHHDAVRAAHVESRTALRQLCELCERAENAGRLGNAYALRARVQEITALADKAFEAHARAGSAYTKARSYLQSIRLLVAMAIVSPGRAAPTGAAQRDEPPAARPDA